MKYNFYTSKEIKPRGWLKRQLQIQAEGLAGKLDKIWPDVRDSAWIGRSREGWERVPYWLDGFIPLAYLLENEEMIERAKKYIDAIIEKQQSDGWICPCKPEERSGYDTWAVQLISKVLTVYYECSGDERLPDIIYRTMKNYHSLLKNGEIKLFDWGKYRWYESFIALNFLKKRCNEDWIYELAAMLSEQGIVIEDLMPEWITPMNRWRFETHIVNIAMMLKAEAITHDLTKKSFTNEAERLYEHLTRYNGTPVEIFTGDECLSGISPIHGTELCAVVEQMYSYEWLYAVTGDSKWAERLEVIAFNALPATISDDMWTHQYVQMSNQIACQRFYRYPVFRTVGPDAHLFGLEPHYGCCTANFGQGWPKLALSAFMKNNDEIVGVLPIPSELNDGEVKITLETNYPFENKFTYKISSSRDFKFKIRIPSFAKNIKVNGARIGCDCIEFDLKAGCNETINLSYEAKPMLVDRENGLKTAVCGSLVFSLPIGFEKKMSEYERDGVERKFPYCDYELIPTTEWSFGFSSEKLETVQKEITDIPFSSENPPIMLKAKVKRIAWGYEDGYDSVASKLPCSRKAESDELSVMLYPYGAAKLRMTEIPLV